MIMLLLVLLLLLFAVFLYLTYRPTIELHPTY